MPKEQMRASQLITTFGPGALVDLPNAAVIVGGLEGWQYYNDPQRIPLVHEPRLQRKCQNLLQVPNLQLRLPP